MSRSVPRGGCCYTPRTNRYENRQKPSAIFCAHLSRANSNNVVEYAHSHSRTYQNTWCTKISFLQRDHLSATDGKLMLVFSRFASRPTGASTPGWSRAGRSRTPGRWTSPEARGWTPSTRAASCTRAAPTAPLGSDLTWRSRSSPWPLSFLAF